MYLRRISVFALTLALGTGLCAMGGCAPKAADAPAEGSSAAEVQEAPTLTIGNEDAHYTIEVTNESGKAITSAAFLETGSAEYTDLPFEGAAEWADGEKAMLNIPPLASDASAAESSSADGASQSAASQFDVSDQADTDVQADAQDDVMLRSQIDLKFTANDGLTYELHGIALEGISQAALRIDGESNLAYLTYANDSGAEESTLATEKAYLEQKRAQEEAAAQAAAQAQAAQAAANQKSAQTSNGSGSGSGSSKPAPSYSSPSGGSQGSGSAPAPEQSEDQCVEGGVAFRD